MLRKQMASFFFRPMNTSIGNSSFNSLPLTLYGDDASPPVRFVQMTASLLNVQYNMLGVDLFKQENRSEFFKKINPLQKVPALTTGKSTITDSHAIALFLCENVVGQTLYPDDVYIRPQVQQMLFFNSSTLFPIDSVIMSDYFAMKPMNQNLMNDWQKALDYLECRLEEKAWLADDKVTLCDLCCGATVSSLQLLIPPSQKHMKVNNWMKNLQQLPCHEINERGLKRLVGFINQLKHTSHQIVSTI